MVNFVCECMELGGVTCYCFLSIVHVFFHNCMSSLTWWLIITLLCTLYFVSSMVCILAFFWFGFFCEFFATIFLCWWIPPPPPSDHQLSCTLGEALILAEILNCGGRGEGRGFSMTELFCELSPWENECIVGISQLSVSVGNIPFKWFF